VRLGKADNVHCYPRTECDGIAVYYLDRLPALFAAVNVKVEKLLFWPRLVAEGERRY
jgi:hypothetical protein